MEWPDRAAHAANGPAQGPVNSGVDQSGAAGRAEGAPRQTSQFRP
jgi:hypothetical protein